MKKYLYLIGALALVITHFVAYWHGVETTNTKRDLEMVVEYNKGLTDARAEEAKRLENMVVIDKEGYEKLVSQNKQFATDISSYRRRLDSLSDRLKAITVTPAGTSTGVGNGERGPGVVRTNLKDHLEWLGDNSNDLGKRGAQCAVKLTACQEIVRTDRQEVSAN